jgi:hypothetical protein
MTGELPGNEGRLLRRTRSADRQLAWTRVGGKEQTRTNTQG